MLNIIKYKPTNNLNVKSASKGESVQDEHIIRPKQNTIYSIQALRGVAAILVVLFHATQFFIEHYQFAPFRGLFLFGFSGVHIFFVLSGFIICMIHLQDVGRPHKYWIYIKKRFVRIYPTYWIILAALLPWSMFRVDGSDQEILKNIYLLNMPAHFINSVCWTLTFEVFFYIIFSFLILNRVLGSVILFCWIFGIALAHLPDMIPFLQINDHLNKNIAFMFRYVFHKYTVLFIIGLLSSYAVIRLRQTSAAIKNRAANISTLVGVVIFISTAIYCLSYKIVNWDLWSITLSFGLAGGMVMASTISDALENFFRRRKVLASLGNASYSIYLIHFPFLMAATAYLKAHLTINSSFYITILFIILSVITVIAGWLFYWSVERPVLKFMRNVVGMEKL